MSILCNVFPHLCFLFYTMQSSKPLILIYAAVSKPLPSTATMSVHNPQSEDKSRFRRTLQVCFACTPLPPLRTQYYPTLFIVQVRTEGWVNIIWIIFPSIHMRCVMGSSQQHSSLSPARSQSRTAKGLDQQDPVDPQKGMRRLCWLRTSCIWESFHREKSSGWVHLHLWGQMGQQLSFSKVEREPGPTRIVHPRGSNVQGAQGFQMVSPITRLNARFSQDPAMSG